MRSWFEQIWGEIRQHPILVIGVLATLLLVYFAWRNSQSGSSSTPSTDTSGGLPLPQVPFSGATDTSGASASPGTTPATTAASAGPDWASIVQQLADNIPGGSSNGTQSTQQRPYVQGPQWDSSRTIPLYGNSGLRAAEDIRSTRVNPADIPGPLADVSSASVAPAATPVPTPGAAPGQRSSTVGVVSLITPQMAAESTIHAPVTLAFNPRSRGRQ